MTAPDAPVWPYTEFIGRRVEAVLCHEAGAAGRQTGRLLAVDDEGECQIEDDTGITRSCWPLLDVVRLDPCAAVSSGRFWSPSTCEKAPGHTGGHCDHFGRSW